MLKEKKSAFSSLLPLSGKQVNVDRRVKREKVSCHILNHDDVYKQLWTSLFKNTFPGLKKQGIKKIWVITDLSVEPLISKQFDVSAFDYHGVEKYKSWNDIPDQVKCNWFNHYPNNFQENPWLSSPFLALRGAWFYMTKLYAYRYFYQKWKTTKLFKSENSNIDVSYFLNLDDVAALKTLTSWKYSNKEDDIEKDFFYHLGMLLLNFSSLIEKKTLFIDYFAKLKAFHQQKKSTLSYNWMKLNWKMVNTLQNLFTNNRFHLFVYYELQPLLWELAHYQIDTINQIKIKDLNAEIIGIKRDRETFKKTLAIPNYFSLSHKAAKQLMQLAVKISPSDISLVKTTLSTLIKKSKEKIFWKILKIYLSSLEKNKITKIKNIAINLLFSEATKKTYQELSSQSKEVINRLIISFFPAHSDPQAQTLALMKLYENDNFQEINILFNHFNQLLKSKDNNFCPALIDSKYQKWWEEIFRPLVPKLIAHKITRIDYGLHSASPHWKMTLYLYKNRRWLDPSTANYYGVLDYNNYKSLPQKIKCQIPSFIFDSYRVKTLRSLDIYLNVILPKLAEYKNHNFVASPSFQNYFQFAFDLNIFQNVDEKTIFSLLKNADIYNDKLKTIFYYLGIFTKTGKNFQNQYLEDISDFFLQSQFWKDTQKSWKKLVDDQFLITWKGQVIKTIKYESSYKHFSQLSSLTKGIIKALLNNNSFLLQKQLVTLANHLVDRIFWWKKLQLLQNDLKKYQITELEGVKFGGNLLTNLAITDLQSLPKETKQEFINLMEIENFFPKLEKKILVKKKQLTELQNNKAKKKLFLILFSIFISLTFLFIAGFSFLLYRKKLLKKTINHFFKAKKRK